MTALWTFPAMLAAAFLVAWGAEAAEFLISQGLALALLAWLQTAPEFAVEAVIAWHAGKDPSMVHLAIANFTGSLRLLVGLGWPMVYVVAWWSARSKHRVYSGMRLRMHHSVEVVGLLPPVLYFFVIIVKGSLGLIDAAILCGMYAAYLVLLLRLPPRGDDVEKPRDVPRVSRAVLALPGRWRGAGVIALFLGGGAILYFTAHPFLDSLLALAVSLGVSEFVFVQWVAPFLSEFPEKVSAFLWARRITRAPVAIMNLVSSNINQWSVLSGLIPVIYCLSRGSTAPLPLDHHQRVEILLTVLQSLLGWLLLASMSLSAYEAAILFLFWLIQFALPSTRDAMIVVYAAWCAWEVVLVLLGRKKWKVFGAFRRTLRGRVRRSA
ncbi:MAG: sodium:calcium antiporter [Thermoanaerobaculia bacterium]